MLLAAVLHLALLAPPCPPGMLLVPAGPFVLGSDADERAAAYAMSSEATRAARWFDAELPRQQATLPAHGRNSLSRTARRPRVRGRGQPSAHAK